MEQLISSNSTVSAIKEQLWCDLAGEVAILNLKTGRYYELDPVSAKIWTFVQKPSTVSEIRDALLKEYEVEPPECEADLLTLLHELQREGLIEIHDSSF